MPRFLIDPNHPTDDDTSDSWRTAAYLRGAERTPEENDEEECEE